MSTATSGSGMETENSGGAWQFLDAAVEGTTNGAIAALRHTLPRGMRPARPLSSSKQIRSKGSTARPRKHSAVEKGEVEPHTSLGLPPTDAASSFIFGGGETLAHLENVTKASNGSVVARTTEDSTKALQSEGDRWLDTSSEGSRTSDPRADIGNPSHGQASHLIAGKEEHTDLGQAGSRASWLQSSGSSDAESISEAFPAGAVGSSSSLTRQEARQHPTNGGAAHQSGSKPSRTRPRPTVVRSQQKKASVHADRVGSLEEVCSLEEARRCASHSNFADAIRACISTLHGPPAAINLLEQFCASWEQSILEASHAFEQEKDELLIAEVRRREEAELHVLKQGDELCCLNAEIRALRERATEWRRLKEERDGELAAERQRRQAAELQTLAFQQQRLCYEDTLKEAAMLRRQLSEALQVAAAASGTGEVARRVAEHECSPLLACCPEERPAVKKRLLVKWHPDKQPSPGHMLLATQVFQEFRNRPEWDL